MKQTTKVCSVVREKHQNHDGNKQRQQAQASHEGQEDRRRKEGGNILVIKRQDWRGTSTATLTSASSKGKQTKMGASALLRPQGRATEKVKQARTPGSKAQEASKPSRKWRASHEGASSAIVQGKQERSNKMKAN